jgi:hypothetical protein
MVRVVGKDAIVGVAQVDNLVVYLEREVPREHPHLDWLRDALSATLVAHPGATAHLHIVEVAGRGGVRAGPRDAMTKIARELDGKLTAAAFVVPEGGFMPALIRSLITGILLIASRQTKTHTFAEVDDALRWLNATGGSVPARTMVLEALETLRAP